MCPNCRAKGNPVRYSSPPGTRRKDKHGYVQLRIAANKWESVHKLVLEEKLGRKLRKNESVHHINGIHDDNRPENLELWVGGIRYGQRAKDVTCWHCGMPYLAELIDNKHVE